MTIFVQRIYYMYCSLRPSYVGLFFQIPKETHSTTRCEIPCGVCESMIKSLLEKRKKCVGLFLKKGVDFCLDFFFQKRPRAQQDAKNAARRANGRVSPTDKTKPSRNRWSTAPHHIAPLIFFFWLCWQTKK